MGDVSADQHRRSSRVLRLADSARMATSALAGLPGWARLLAVYAAARIVSALFLALGYAWALSENRQIAQFVETPDYLGFLQSWDGQNYRHIALLGYPDELPRTSDGDVQKNVWAFLPLYPLLARGLRELLGSGADPGAIAVAMSVIFGAAATLMLYRVLLLRLPATAAFWGAVLFCFSPLSFLLQCSYAESLFLFLMFVTVWAIVRGRFVLSIPFGVAAAFTHPGALALAAAIVLLCGIRLFQGERMSPGSRMRAATAALLITAAALSWPVIAAAVTGVPDAYFLTELAWWRLHVGDVTFVPFTPWFLMANRYWGGVGVAGVLILAAATGYGLVRARRRGLGTDLTIYLASYLAYLFAVFLPQQSTFRMLLPVSPLLALPLFTHTPRRRVLTLMAFVSLQPVAIYLLWIVQPP